MKTCFDVCNPEEGRKGDRQELGVICQVFRKASNDFTIADLRNIREWNQIQRISEEL